MDLLFILAHWHALAKFRQHTDLSLDILESVTIQLGQSLRVFEAQTCSVYNTRELKREEIARRQRAESASTANKSAPDNAPDMEDLTCNVAASSSTSTPIQTKSTSKKASGKLRKTLNLNTYKDHSLGDYVETIRRCGTIDSYSTESVNYSPFHLRLLANTSAMLDGTRAPLSEITLSQDQP